MAAGTGPAAVTDAHLHLWDLAASPYAWLAGAPAELGRSADPEEVRGPLEALGVTRAVLVQADDTDADTAHLQRVAASLEAAAAAEHGDVGADAARTGAVGADAAGTAAVRSDVAGTDTSEAVDAHTGTVHSDVGHTDVGYTAADGAWPAERGLRRVDVVGWLPLRDPEAVRAALADPARTDRLVGVRHLVHDEPDPGFLDEPAVAESLDLLAAAGLPLDVPDAFARHMEQVVRVARRHPGLTVVLDHLGKPPLGDPALMVQWREQLAAIAACPNVVAKVSGLATSGNGDMSAAFAAADYALSVFGADRLMLGSDWPIAPRHFDLTSGFAPLLDHVRTWAPDDVAAVTHGTAARIYRRLPESPSAA